MTGIFRMPVFFIVMTIEAIAQKKADAVWQSAIVKHYLSLSRLIRFRMHFSQLLALLSSWFVLSCRSGGFPARISFPLSRQWIWKGLPDSSYWVSFKRSAKILCSPLAPVPLLTAILAISRRASRSQRSSCP